MIDTPAEQFNRRLGLVLFTLYLLLYVVFVGLVVYDYTLMGKIVVAGLNLAIVYGFTLIVSAFALAVIYMMMSRNDPE